MVQVKYRNLNQVPGTRVLVPVLSVEFKTAESCPPSGLVISRYKDTEPYVSFKSAKILNYLSRQRVTSTGALASRGNSRNEVIVENNNKHPKLRASHHKQTKVHKISKIIYNSRKKYSPIERSKQRKNQKSRRKNRVTAVPNSNHRIITICRTLIYSNILLLVIPVRVKYHVSCFLLRCVSTMDEKKYKLHVGVWICCCDDFFILSTFCALIYPLF